MYGLCSVRSGVIEVLAALMNINSEPQSGGAGAAIKLELRRTCDSVQMSTCVHITHHSQMLGFWVPDQRRSLMHWLVKTRFGNIVHNICLLYTSDAADE